MSGTPSPFRSPMPATDPPNWAVFDSVGPLGVLAVPFISVVCFMVPSGFISITWTAPRPRPASASRGAPTAMSGTPSPSRSPMPATDSPNWSSLPREGPLGVLAVPFISTVFFTVPLAFINMMWIAPRLLSPASS